MIASRCCRCEWSGSITTTPPRLRFDRGGACLVSRPGWRKGWDSNPRGAYAPGGFQDRCLKPLGHPSLSTMSNTYTLPPTKQMWILPLRLPPPPSEVLERPILILQKCHSDFLSNSHHCRSGAKALACDCYASGDRGGGEA